MEKGVNGDGVLKADWEMAGEATAGFGETEPERGFGDGFAKGDRGDAEIEGEIGVLEGIGDGRWTRERQGRQKNKLLLAEASAYVRKPAHLQWAEAIQPSHWTESGWRLVFKQTQHIHEAHLYFVVPDISNAMRGRKQSKQNE